MVDQEALETAAKVKHAIKRGKVVSWWGIIDTATEEYTEPEHNAYWTEQGARDAVAAMPNPSDWRIAIVEARMIE